MKKRILACLIPALLLCPPAFAAAAADQDEALRAEYQAMLEEAERTREGALAAREEAIKVAEMARETARMEAELAREEAEMSRLESQRSTETAEQRRSAAERAQRERAVRQEEMERAREELSKAHREMREATREVARAHRELAVQDRMHRSVQVVNLGDRAVIGLVMGKATAEGVEIIAVSPDGPAERAGLQAGDIMVSISGEDLAKSTSARQAVQDVMDEVEDGEELPIVVRRDEETQELTVTAEVREPTSWQTMIRLPEIEVVEGVPSERRVIVETIEVPEIDHEALHNHVAELTERLKAREFSYHSSDSGDFEYEGSFDVEIDDFSDFAGHAMREANVWFGLPYSQGLELAAVNEGLGAYFKTDYGVLVIKAKEDNAYQLESGDVILKVDARPVESPADMMRALREIEPGDEIEIEIKRERRDRTLNVVMPENRLGYLGTFPHH